MTDLSGRHAVVTGGGTGIGAAIARVLSKAGAAVTVMARDRARLEDTAAGLETAQAVAIDVTEEGSVERAFARAEEGFGPVHILVNNAGVAPTAPFAKMSLADWNGVLAVNLTGVFLCSRAVARAMLTAKTGRIINIASTAGLKGYPYVSAYVASKHGVIGLTRALAAEFATKGVTVNSICPGYTDTDIVRRAVQTIVEKTGRSEADALSELVKSNPQRRLIDPEEVASLALWLCGEEARSVTGQALAVAGGEVM